MPVQLTGTGTGIGTPADAEATGDGSVIAILKRIRTLLSSVGGMVVGNLAHDDPDAGNPVKIGGHARSALPATVAADDRVDAYYDRHGHALVRTAAQTHGPWTAHHVPAANAQATITKAAVPDLRNVCTTLTVSLASTAAAPAAWQGSVALIDGASGGVAYLWRTVIAIPATPGVVTGFVVPNVWFVGSVGTALTLEFSGAAGANTIESVSMGGTTIAE